MILIIFSSFIFMLTLLRNEEFLSMVQAVALMRVLGWMMVQKINNSHMIFFAQPSPAGAVSPSFFSFSLSRSLSTTSTFL